MYNLNFMFFCKVKFYDGKRKKLPDLMSGNYRPHLLIKGDAEYLGVYIEQGDVKNFDETVTCCISPIYEGVDYSKLKEDTFFFIMEGSNTVGEGVIEEIFKYK